MNKYKLSEHKDEIITHIIKNLIWFPIAATIPIVGKLINYLHENINSKSQYITFTNISIVICVLLSVFSIILCIIFIKKCNNKNNIAEETVVENNKISYDYRFSSIVAELVFNSNRKDITSTISYKMNVLADSVEDFKRDVIWSGSKYVGTKITSKNGEYELIDSDRNKSPYQYRIVFDTAKKRGELIELTTETSVIDENFDMIPMYSFMAKYQIDKLILRVIAPKKMIKNVKKSIYLDRAREICIENPTRIDYESVGNLVRYTYEIDNPTLLYNYFIEWEFTNSQ